jgi:OCT family organic cation transporter-like MFS transporter 4/5
MYAVFRFITCCALPVSWMSGSAYGLEVWSPSWRRIIISVRDFPIAQFFLCGVIYLVRDWTSLHLVIGLICACGLIPWFWVPESPRWLIMHGKKDEAEKIFLEIARVNKRELTADQLKQMRAILDNVEGDSKMDSNLNYLDMFRKDVWAKTLIMFSAWIMVCLGYYALTFNSTSLAGDPILNYFLATAADIPVCLYLFLLLDRLAYILVTLRGSCTK